jgi:hypothetical protein
MGIIQVNLSDERSIQAAKEAFKEAERRKRIEAQKARDAERRRNLEAQGLASQFISVEAAAKRYSCSSRTLRRWAKNDGFPIERWGIRLHRVNVVAADIWMRERRNRHGDQ